MTDKIDQLVCAFDRLAGNVSEVICYMQKTEKMIRRTGRVMLVQTILAVVVLLMFGAMAWVVGSAWSEVASVQSSLAEIEKSNQAIYDYLIGKFPEDSAELAIVKAEPAAAQMVMKAIEPLPDPGGKRAAKAIERRDDVLRGVRAAFSGGQSEYELVSPDKTQEAE